jgi:GT2 family glycosyltransferase
VLYSCGHSYTDDHFCRTMTRLPVDVGVLTDLPSCSLASTLVRAEVFEGCGLLNPIYEIYYESSDLSFRARAAGWTCACNPDAVAYNEATETAGPDTMHSFFYFNRNRLLFWRLHDAAVYDAVRGAARTHYEALQVELAGTRYGLSAEKESVRRGLEEGLRLSADAAFLATPIPRIAAYDKTSAVLLQEGHTIQPAGA